MHTHTHTQRPVPDSHRTALFNSPAFANGPHDLIGIVMKGKEKVGLTLNLFVFAEELQYFRDGRAYRV